MKKFLILFFITFFYQNTGINAQENLRLYDTVYFSISELQVNSQKCLTKLKKVVKKPYYQIINETKSERVMTCEVAKDKDSNLIFTLCIEPVTSCSHKYAKGYFMVDDICVFVNGKDTFSDYPKDFFTFTDRKHSFYYLKPAKGLRSQSCSDCAYYMDFKWEKQRLKQIGKNIPRQYSYLYYTTLHPDFQNKRKQR